MAKRPNQIALPDSRASTPERRAEIAWVKNGEFPFWKLAKLELIVKIQKAKHQKASKPLFSEVEIERRRNSILNAAKQPSTTEKRKPHDLSYRNKKELQKKRLADMIGKLFSLSTNSSSTEPAGATIASSNLIEVASAHPMSLFSQKELHDRRRPVILRLKRNFRKQMALVKETFKDYLAWISQLPEEDIDSEIQLLRQRYIQLGRQREWYAAYILMAQRVVKESKHSANHEGKNEPETRILQQDFLQSMKSRYSTYWRLHELRAYCYKHELFDEIGEISRCSSDLQGDALLRPPVDFSTIEQLVSSIEATIQNHKLAQQTVDGSGEQFDQTDSSIDHEARLAQFQNFKRMLSETFTPANTLLTELKSIVSYDSGWQLEYQVFRAFARTQRIEQSQKTKGQSRENDTKTGTNGGTNERSEVLKFAKQIVNRMEQELDADIEFKRFCQAKNTMSDESIIHSLEQVLAQIELKLHQQGTGALDEIHQLKVDFLADMYTGSGTKNIVPLFRR